MFKEYDVPLDPDAGLPENFVQNDGSDWSLGTPSVLIPGWGVHDAWLDLDGQLWFTCNIPNRRTTIGKIDPASGAVKLLKVPALNGLAAQAGLKSGDVLLTLNGTRVRNMDDIDHILQRDFNKNSVLIEIGRGRFSYSLTLPLD